MWTKNIVSFIKSLLYLFATNYQICFYFSMVRIQKKISDGLTLLHLYATKPWIFRNENLQELRTKVNDRDRDLFDFDMRLVSLF